MANENLTWQELHELIRTMLTRLETQKSVTRTISRINYAETLGILRNFTVFQYDKSIKMKIILQEGVMTIQMERR